MVKKKKKEKKNQDRDPKSTKLDEEENWQGRKQH